MKTEDGWEVDFLARHRSGGEELIQECADLSGPHPRALQRLLVLDRDALARVNAPAVVVQPAFEWLLAAPGDD